MRLQAPRPTRSGGDGAGRQRRGAAPMRARAAARQLPAGAGRGGGSRGDLRSSRCARRCCRCRSRRWRWTCRVAALGVDRGGAVVARRLPRAGARVHGVLSARPASPGSPPAPRDDGAPPGSLDTAGVTPRIAALAGGVGGGGERARARDAGSRRGCAHDFVYTTEFVGRGGDSPIEDFLLRDRRGHCEYFASAMVLMLRARGDPGAPRHRLPRRRVERLRGLPGSCASRTRTPGWRPGRRRLAGLRPDAAGGPAGGGAAELPHARSARPGTRSLFRWDRWVISYDFDDQVGALGGLRGLVAAS